MSRLDLAGVAVDRCPSCGGIWLDAGELGQLMEGGKKARTEIDSAEDIGGTEPEFRPNPMLCPRDHHRMSVHRAPSQEHIEYDLCSKCGGMFLDAGELADLTRFTLAERIAAMLG